MKRKKKTAEDKLQSAIDAAWRLVETCGLHRDTFDKASLDAINDALWLIASGAPVAEVVEAMNNTTDCGKRSLAELRAVEEKAMDQQSEAMSGKKLASAHLAAVLARMDVGALLAELYATMAAETDIEMAKLIFLGVLQLHQGAELNPRYQEIKRGAIEKMGDKEWLKRDAHHTLTLLGD